MLHYPYLEVIGSLTYAAMGTCPDICAAVWSLSPFTSLFGRAHVDGVKHIMHYLAGCPDCGIMYTMGDAGLVGYTDADWANDCVNHQSISRYAFLYSGGVVSWMSKQQSAAATSSTHAEYVVGGILFQYLARPSGGDSDLRNQVLPRSYL